MKNVPDCIFHLIKAGIYPEDAHALRRISMTLHRWHELECGDGNDHGSWCISRGRKDNGGAFEYADDGKPYMEYHSNTANGARYTLLADKERGALKRLAKIVAQYPGFSFYVQGDPRGASLYIMRPGDLRDGAQVDSCYTNGIAVYR